MSGFDLIPVGGGDPIHLPPGETVLGRGPFLGVSDKRVSRHHGLLENLNGQLRLKPTHLNPCFLQSPPTDEPQALQKDTWQPLHHGDVFSLLPGQFIYEVVAVGGGNSTLRNSQIIEKEGAPLVPAEPDVELLPAVRELTPPPEEAASAAVSKQDETNVPNRRLNQGEAALTQELENVPSPACRRRVLPAWMMAAVAAPHSSSSISPKGLKRRKEPAAAKEATPPTTCSPEEAELREEKPRKKKISDEEAQDKTKLTARRLTDVNKVEESKDSGSIAMETDEEGQHMEKLISDISDPDNKKSKKRQSRTKKVESVDSRGGSAPGPRLRQPCPYGKDCYRKNPVHFQEHSHPGDTDYEDEEEDEEEEVERPECPYGADCYRKNPLHRKEFNHTRRPARSTRAAPKKPAGDDDDEDEDLEDSDSFVNDDSEDVGDDSDYVPPDDGGEDIKALQREARAFMKRRK
ncbi:aprataxin and PNK-like factor [Aulostomus maculatus]